MEGKSVYLQGDAQRWSEVKDYLLDSLNSLYHVPISNVTEILHPKIGQHSMKKVCEDLKVELKKP